MVGLNDHWNPNPAVGASNSTTYTITVDIDAVK
jgi:hypothetical protein